MGLASVLFSLYLALKQYYRIKSLKLHLKFSEIRCFGNEKSENFVRKKKMNKKKSRTSELEESDAFGKQL